MIWQVLDVRSIWIKELAAALSTRLPTVGWLPRFSSTGILQHREEESRFSDPPLTVRSFPLQRGFARYPLESWLKEANRITQRLTARAGAASESTLVCTAPQYAEVLERWPGPSIYYATDYFPAYRNASASVRGLEQRLAAAATLVCVNSARIEAYLSDAGCPSEKLLVLPNATRAANVLSAAAAHPSQPPSDLSTLPRPIAGIMGNLGDNTDWVLLKESVTQTPWLSWVFIGPTDSKIAHRDQSEARTWLMQRNQNVRFLGAKPHSALKDYARSLDVAVLPYQKIEPTFSGSSTRFYEHLAACRPMIATRGCAELITKEPLLKLIDTSSQLTAALAELRNESFRDGLEELRWQASQSATWESRADQMIDELTKRLSVGRAAVA